jgi:hypothetical protein
MKSDFYKVITRLSFGELLRKLNISETELSPKSFGRVLSV